MACGQDLAGRMPVFLGGMISAPGHARVTAPPPGSCCIPDVNPFGSAQGYVEPRTTWCCSQVRSRRGKRTGDCKPWPMQPCTRTRTASNRT